MGTGGKVLVVVGILVLAGVMAFVTDPARKMDPEGERACLLLDQALREGRGEPGMSYAEFTQRLDDAHRQAQASEHPPDLEQLLFYSRNLAEASARDAQGPDDFGLTEGAISARDEQMLFYIRNAQQVCGNAGYEPNE
jgi:hypothetical protein